MCLDYHVDTNACALRAPLRSINVHCVVNRTIHAIHPRYVGTTPIHPVTTTTTTTLILLNLHLLSLRGNVDRKLQRNGEVPF